MVILGIENVETLQTIADTCNAYIGQCNRHISITQSVLIKKTKRGFLFQSIRSLPIMKASHHSLFLTFQTPAHF